MLQGKSKIIIGVMSLVVVLGVIGFTAGKFLLFNTQGSTGSFTKIVSGLFDINGVVPFGSSINLFARKARSNDPFIPFATNIQPKDQSAWGFTTGKTGATYEIMATLVNNGSVIDSAGPISVTVPAINQIFTFNVPASNSAAAPSTTLANAEISAHVHINGYIPPGATITLERRKQESKYFAIVAQNIAAHDEQAVTFPELVAGQTYEAQALLYSSSQQLIGTSEALTVVAPAANEELAINSTAVPPATPTPIPTAIPVPTTISQSPVTSIPAPTPTPAPQIAISGTIQFQGQAPLNSRIVVLERLTGAQSFQVAVDNITPQDGTSWNWTGPTNGQMYDMIAVLKQKQSDGTDKDISSSTTLTVSAPAVNEALAINSGFTLPSPSSTVTISCNTYDSSSQTWSVSVSFASITNAQSYWYQIGTTDGGIELTNFTQNATNNTSQSFTYQFKNSTTYYARYAYGPFLNLQSGSSQFSAFSSTTQLRCTQ